ncbi:hypothetical protein CTRI78_v002110 [Colletotrichum trifolii]|uniref:DinB-like domain-containing protein n=1 Tax=Colletotrichum trifolii TaxID=5466 RepID=A0A4R8RMX2_COLTR|nr:hypothetical protein CTRI78_v002110 [Colletotrichum trifolii]
MARIFQGFSLPWSQDVAYSELSRDEEGKSSTESPLQTWPARRLFHVATRTFVIILAAYGLFSLVTPHLSRPRSHNLSCNCGETIDEARSNGCVYDSLAAAWLPPHCRSAALTAEFESLGPNPPDAAGNTWGYWHDLNQTRAMTLAEVSELPEAARHGRHARFFATHEWHLVHCVFYWRKMWESARCARGEPGALCGGGGGGGVLVVERRYDTLMHINHCQTMFLMRDPLDHVAAEAGVALHSDELHVARPHEHAGAEMGAGHHASDPYDEKKQQHEYAGGPSGR